ncbi:pantetheine-phosphate adenylyltransferase [Marinilactibacillus piezotolerans]|uniref:pantetheine-phosphate adenylyltransferase n=1 Tax=Marinilactibacillus piezotolerans TaxID=258723 RepID=UPI0015C49FEB
MKIKALYAGSFDPFTYGHLNIVARAAALFDEVYISVSENTSKQSLFTMDQRIEIISSVMAQQNIQNVSVIKHSGGLTVELARSLGVKALVRGIRSVKDMEYEMDIASMNKTQAADIETIFLMSDEKYRFISSSLIKEVAKFDGDLNKLVPKVVLEKLQNHLQ